MREHYYNRFERMVNATFYRLFFVITAAALFGAIYADAHHQYFTAGLCGFMGLVLKIDNRKTKRPCNQK